jgi:hypothetical protein
LSGEDSSELRGSKKKEAKRKESIKSYVFPCTLGRCYVVESRNPSPAYVRIVRWLCPRKGILEDGFVTEGCSTMAFFFEAGTKDGEIVPAGFNKLFDCCKEKLRLI